MPCLLSIITASRCGKVLPAVPKMLKTLVTSDGKGPGITPETSIPGGRRAGGDEDEASGGADGAITAKDGLGSEKCLSFDEHTYRR